MWQQIWFIINMGFVALLITFLFVHRSVTLARLAQDAEQLRKAKRLRLILGVLTIVALSAMVFSFLMNMHLNG